MKIFQLLLKITDFSSGISVEQNYLLNAYSTKEKAKEGISFFKNEVFQNLVYLFNEVQEEKSRIIFQAQKFEEKFISVEKWKNEELKKEFYDNLNKLDIFMEKFLPHAKPAINALIDNHSEYEIDFDIIGLDLI